MAEIFKFQVATPGGSEVSVHSVKCYESADGSIPWTEIAAELLANMPVDSGVYTWNVAAADPAKFHSLTPVSDSAIERQSFNILPPRPTAGDSILVYCYTIDAGMDVQANVKFTAKPKNEFSASAAGKVVLNKQVVDTDVTGYAEITVPANCGIVTITLGKAQGELDTTGIGGNVVNFASLL